MTVCVSMMVMSWQCLQPRPATSSTLGLQVQATVWCHTLINSQLRKLMTTSKIMIISKKYIFIIFYGILCISTNKMTINNTNIMIHQISVFPASWSERNLIWYSLQFKDTDSYFSLFLTAKSAEVSCSI